MAFDILVIPAGFDQPYGPRVLSNGVPQIAYYVARTVMLTTGERLCDVPISRKVASIGIANRLLKRARRRTSDAYLVRAVRRDLNHVRPLTQQHGDEGRNADAGIFCAVPSAQG